MIGLGQKQLHFDRVKRIFNGEDKGATMILPTDIHTLDNFRRRSKEHVDRLQSTGRPEVLTVNGKAAVVVQDAAAYQQQIERIEVLEALAESISQIKTGEVYDARKAVGKLIGEIKRK